MPGTAPGTWRRKHRRVAFRRPRSSVGLLGAFVAGQHHVGLQQHPLQQHPLGAQLVEHAPPARAPVTSSERSIVCGAVHQHLGLDDRKDGCQLCHQMGNRATREIPKSLGEFPTSVEAWDRRVRVGQRGPQMSARAGSVRPPARAGDVRRLDRSHRRRRGAAAAAAAAGRRTQPRADAVGLGQRPPRTSTTRSPPTGAIPTIDARGKVYGVDFADDALIWVDPLEHTAGSDPDADPRAGRDRRSSRRRSRSPSPYHGEEMIWSNRSIRTTR